MSLVPSLMEEALVPGLQMAVISDGIVEVLPFGIRDAQSGARVTEDTVFEAASLGKPVFSYGVLRLASEGKIDLDAPIGRYVDGLAPDTAAITARQLLSHSAGLPNGRASGPMARTISPTPRFSYSGEGIRLLQRALERITGQGLQEYMEGAVFTPLGMTSSSFVWRDEYALSKAFGHGYTGSSAGRSRIAEAQAPSSLETTAGDYARFLLAAARGTGLRPDLARELLQPQVALEGCVTCLDRPAAATLPGRHWALGFGIEQSGGRTFAWHWGDNQTMQSYAAIEPSGRRGVVILTNSANGHSIAPRIAASVLGSEAPGYAWLGSYGSYTEPERRLLSAIVRDGISALQPEDLELPRPTLRLVTERLAGGGRPAEAAALARRLATRSDATAADHAMLAEALRRQGVLAEARAAAELALRLEPANSSARVTLERIAQAERVVPPTSLRAFAGRYSSPFGPLEVRSDGRKLTAHLLDQPPSDMLALSDTSFLMEAMGAPIEFVRDSTGIVTHAIVRAGGEIRLPRLK